MGSEALFGVLCGILAAQGREEALLGDDLPRVRRAFALMVPNSDEVHAYFEIPLLGSPGLDVHCALSHVDADVCVPEGADPLWRSVVRWFSQVGPIHTGYNDVAVMAEADTSGGLLGQAGVYLVQHDQA